MAAAGDVTSDRRRRPTTAHQRQRWDKGRVEIFSDGVFAIAITLLVLDISVAPADYDHLRHALLHEWPAYLAYVTSFLTVGSVWIAHHSLFSRLRFIDPTLLRLNLLLLMTAAFLPFPTSVLAQALHHGGTAERTAVVFYGAAALVIEALLRAAQRYAASQHELQMEPGDRRPLPARPALDGMARMDNAPCCTRRRSCSACSCSRGSRSSATWPSGSAACSWLGSEGRLSLDFGWLIPKRWGLARSGLSFGLAPADADLSGEEHRPDDPHQQHEVEHDLERDEDHRRVRLRGDVAEPDGADHRDHEITARTWLSGSEKLPGWACESDR